MRQINYHQSQMTLPSSESSFTHLLDYRICSHKSGDFNNIGYEISFFFVVECLQSQTIIGLNWMTSVKSTFIILHIYISKRFELLADNRVWLSRLWLSSTLFREAKNLISSRATSDDVVKRWISRQIWIFSKKLYQNNDHELCSWRPVRSRDN